LSRREKRELKPSETVELSEKLEKNSRLIQEMNQKIPSEIAREE